MDLSQKSRIVAKLSCIPRPGNHVPIEPLNYRPPPTVPASDHNNFNLLDNLNAAINSHSITIPGSHHQKRAYIMLSGGLKSHFPQP